MRFAHHVASVGKCELDETGKYPVNENDEKKFVRSDLHAHRPVLSAPSSNARYCAEIFSASSIRSGQFTSTHAQRR
jgi:hypothetical protein